MKFQKASQNAFSEMDSRKGVFKRTLRIGVQFLDDAITGILPTDLVLIGAPPGVGKTQFCCNMALSNLELGKRVHYIALEAEKLEIDRRLKFNILARKYFADPNRPKLLNKLTFDRWYMGEFLEPLEKYETESAREMAEIENLNLLYKSDVFTVDDLNAQIMKHAEDTDLIIVDHVHYFDFDDDSENRAIKEIAKAARNLALEQEKPIVLIAHLRKRDRGNDDLVSGMEEFHGTSELYKIATKVITFASGGTSPDGKYETFFRIPKNRLNGGSTRYMGRVFFNPQTGNYEKAYKVGWAEQSRKNGFAELSEELLPEWARHGSIQSSNSYHMAPSKPKVFTIPTGTRNLFDGTTGDERD